MTPKLGVVLINHTIQEMVFLALKSQIAVNQILVEFAGLCLVSK